MEGVTVLSSEVVGSGSTAFLILGIICLVLACAALGMGIYMCVDGSGLGLLVLLGAIVLGAMGIEGVSNGTSEKEYQKMKVIVEDTVSYNDFTSRYEVLDRDGDIWIVKEKE